MSFQRYAIWLVCGSLLLLGLTGLFNRIVDPFWYYRDIEIHGFNAVKTKFRRYERHVKPVLLMREQPEAIILGSSFAEVGFDPLDPLFTDSGRLKSMNFALAGASWDMVQCDFEFAAGHAPIKRALVGFHPGNLPLVDCARDFAGLGKASMGELLFSDRALLASIQTIQEQRIGKPSHTREGMYFYARDAVGVDRRFREYFMPRLKAIPRCLSTGTRQVSADLPGENTLDLSGLRRMIDTARRHGIELVLFAYPSHAYSLELDRRCGQQDARWQAMQRIAGLLDTESVSGRVSAWHFYDYNDMTAEPVAAKPEYWQDPEHFNFEMGHLMLKDMFGGGLPKYGRTIVAAKVAADYKDYLHGRDKFLQLHPEFHAGMQPLLAQP